MTFWIPLSKPWRMTGRISSQVGTTSWLKSMWAKNRILYLPPAAYLASTDPNRNNCRRFAFSKRIRWSRFRGYTLWKGETNGSIGSKSHSIDDHVEEILAIGMQAVLDKNQAF